MKRIALGFLMLVASAALLVGCSNSFINATNRVGYLLINPVSVQRVRLDNGTLIGTPVTLNAPSGIRTFAYRSQSGTLLGIGGDKILYRINPVSGLCTAVNTTPLAIADPLGALASSPSGSKMYYISNSGVSYEISPSAGTLTTTGATVTYAAGDANTGTPSVGGLAYGSDGKLYLSDGLHDVLVRLDSPLGGVAHTVGPFGVDVAGSSGLGEDPVTGKMYLAFDSGVAPGVYRINTTTGVATQVGDSTLASEGITVIP